MLHLLAVVGNRSATRYPDRAKQVVLANATFDQDGRIMVTPGGFLPSQKVTNSYIERVRIPSPIQLKTRPNMPRHLRMCSLSNILYSAGSFELPTVGKMWQSSYPAYVRISGR